VVVVAELGAASVDGVVVGVVVVVVVEGVVDAGVVLVPVDVGVVDVGVVVAPEGADEVVVVEVPLDEEDDVVVWSVEDGLVFDDVVTRPLLCSCVSISCWTAATAAATAPGVALAPSCGSALSCLRSAASCAASSLEGWELSVTTIWSASAVVRQEVHW
jgi:hypothetical protein